MSTPAITPGERTPSESSGRPTRGLGALVAVLCFGTVYPVVTAWADANVGIATATLAAIPGIVFAAHGWRRR